MGHSIPNHPLLKPQKFAKASAHIPSFFHQHIKATGPSNSAFAIGWRFLPLKTIGPASMAITWKERKGKERDGM